MTPGQWSTYYLGGQADASSVGGVYVSDADLAALDARVRGEALAVDAAVSQCPELAPGDAHLWSGVMVAWQAKHVEVQAALASSILGLGDAQLAADLTAIESDVLAMQDRVHAACPKAIAGTGGTSLDWGSVVVIVAVCAAVAVGLWALAPVALAALGRRAAHG